MRSRETDGGGKLFLESVLRCRVLQYTCVRNSPSFAYKVRINKNELQSALMAGRASGCFVDLWRQNGLGDPRGTTNSGVRMEADDRKGGSMVKERKDVKMTCWNSRGLKNSVPFLNALIEEDSKVIVVSEHWLWPFELHRLQEVHRFQAQGRQMPD